MTGPKIYVDGIDVGNSVVSEPRPEGEHIVVDLSFRPNWVGIWKLAALLADRHDSEPPE